MRHPLPLLVAAALAALLLFDGRLFPLRVDRARLLSGGPTVCAEEETAEPEVSAWRAAWWWLWNSFGSGIARAEAGRGERRIVIDTAARRLTLYQGAEVLRTYPVAVGKPSTPTPPGEWRVVHKSRNWGGGFGTRWLGLNVPWGIYGIHGTNKPGSIGTFASAGCIRMFNAHVEELFTLVELGTPVTIVGPLPEVAARERLAPGTSGKAVVVLQVRLRQAGFDPGAIDGRFGPQTERSVRLLQSFYGFPPSGELSRDQQRLVGFPE